tara:strand:+ start:284 stop:1051 length:768 start_codon:yes stop_codon:yes gene_type:complete
MKTKIANFLTRFCAPLAVALVVLYGVDALFLRAINEPRKVVAQQPKVSTGLSMNVQTFARITAPGGAIKYVWAIPAGVSADEKGNVVEIRGKAGKYTVKVVAIYVDFDAKTVTTKEGAVEITIGGKGPVIPTPGPKPTPPKPVNLPDGKYKLAKFAYDLAVNAPSIDSDAAKKIASVYTSKAAAVAAGGIKSVSELNKETAKAMRELFQDPARTKMRTEFFTPLAGQLGKVLKGKSLQDHQTAWQELATGLKAVK